MIAIILAGTVMHTAQGAAAISPACAAAERVIEELWASGHGQPPLSAAVEPRFKSPTWARARELRAGGWSGPPPSVALLDRWEREGATTVTRCANVRAYSEAKAIAAATSAAPDADRTVVALPVVIGDEALVEVRTYRRSLGGSVYLYLLRRSESGWGVISRRMLAIS